MEISKKKGLDNLQIQEIVGLIFFFIPSLVQCFLMNVWCKYYLPMLVIVWSKYLQDNCHVKYGQNYNKKNYKMFSKKKEPAKIGI